jgi:hypothetical protein
MTSSNLEKGHAMKNIFAGDNFLSQMLRPFLQGGNKKGSKFCCPVLKKNPSLFLLLS